MDKDIRELVFDEELFDPFEEDDDSKEPVPDEGDDNGIGAPMEEPFPVDPAADERPAAERIADLLASMPGQRRTLLRVIDFCRDEKSAEEIDDYIAGLKKHCYSIYSPVVFRELLEQAGALAYEGVRPDADAADEGDAAPSDEGALQSEVLVDGDVEVPLEYREIDEVEPGRWHATEEGLAVVDAQDDEGATVRLIADEPQYEGIYDKILAFCRCEGGRLSQEIDRLVNDEEVLQEPRRYAGYFVGHLERKGALEWKEGWVTTEAGASYLDKKGESCHG